MTYQMTVWRKCWVYALIDALGADLCGYSISNISIKRRKRSRLVGFSWDKRDPYLRFHDGSRVQKFRVFAAMKPITALAVVALTVVYWLQNVTKRRQPLTITDD